MQMIPAILKCHDILLPQVQAMLLAGTSPKRSLLPIARVTRKGCCGLLVVTNFLSSFLKLHSCLLRVEARRSTT